MSSVPVRNLVKWSATYAAYFAALVGFLIAILAFWPGYMSPDSVVQLAQAREGVTTNVYPPLMAYIWRFTDHIVPGPGGMLLLHNLVFWGALATIVRACVRNPFLQLIAVLGAGLLPPSFASLGTIWKDVGMQSFLLAGVAGLIVTKRGNPWAVGISLLAFAVAIGYRHNAVAAAVPLLGYNAFLAVRLVADRWPSIVHQLSQRGLYAASVAMMMVVIVAVPVLLVDVVQNYGVQDAHLWSAALVHDLAGISVLRNEDFLPRYVNPQNITVGELRRMYSPLHANSLFVPESRKYLEIADPLPDKAISYQLTPAQADDLKFRWMIAVLDNFGSYAYHRWQIAERLLVIRPRQPWYPFIAGIDPNPWGLHFNPSAFNSFVMRVINYAAFGSCLFAAWAYYTILSVCFVLSLLVRFRYSPLMQILYISVILYLVSILVFGMSGDFRYNIWGVTGAFLAPILLAAGRGGTATQNSERCA